jgi:hypothetical protein
MRSHVRCILKVYFFYHHHHMMRMALTRSALRDYSASAAAATTTRPSGSHVWRTEGAMSGRTFAKSHISRKSSASSPCFCQCTGKAGTSSAAIAPSILHSSMQCSRPRPCNSRPCARAHPAIGSALQRGFTGTHSIHLCSITSFSSSSFKYSQLYPELSVAAGFTQTVNSMY